jgi:hypothetical protein
MHCDNFYCIVNSYRSCQLELYIKLSMCDVSYTECVYDTKHHIFNEKFADFHQCGKYLTNYFESYFITFVEYE